MTRAIFLAAIAAGRLVEGETTWIERYVAAPVSIVLLALLFTGALG